MTYPIEENELVKKLFLSGKSTKEVQDYLMEKYKVTRSKTSVYIKIIRKQLNIYNKNESKN